MWGDCNIFDGVDNVFKLLFDDGLGGMFWVLCIVGCFVYVFDLFVGLLWFDLFCFGCGVGVGCDWFGYCCVFVGC